MTTTTDCPIVAAIDRSIERAVEMRNRVAELLVDDAGEDWECGVHELHLVFIKRAGCDPDPRTLARTIGENWKEYPGWRRGTLKGMPCVTVSIAVDEPTGKDWNPA